jgi:autotransporter-associated beta strand protein
LWSGTTNWTGGTVASGTDAVANFDNLTLPANNTVHLNGSYTVGQLTFGDQGNAYGWTLDNNGSSSNVLTLNTSTSIAPVIDVVNQSATISATLSGSQGLTLAGGGILNLTGSSNYTGVTNVSSGTLVLGSAANNSLYSTGLKVDLDPTQSTINTSGGVITSVSDISGSSNNASSGYGSVTLSTINGHKAFSFNSSGLAVSSYSATTKPETVIAVIDPSSVTGPSAIVGPNDGSSKGGLELRLNGGKLDALDAATTDYGSSSSSVSANAVSVIAYSFNSSAASYYINGNSAGSGSVPTFTNSGTLTIGYKATNSGPSSTASGEFFAGTMGTVLVYNTALTAAQISSITSYLTSEYAAASTTLGTTEVLLSSSSSNLSVASNSQSISSLAGVAGSNVYLGAGVLTVGADGTSTVFAGNISDTGTGAVGTGGELVKVGAGTLNLSGSVLNTGGAQVSAGTLLVSGTYGTSGPTLVSGGTLSITGTDSDTGLHTLSGGTMSISGTNSTTGAFNISSGANLTLSGTSTATGPITVSGGTLTLVANTGNINTSNATSSVIGSPSAITYGNNLGTATIQLRSDTSVTFTNAGPTGGTGGYPNGTTINFDVNNVGLGSTTASGAPQTPQTLTLGSTTSGASGFATYVTTINVTGGNGYTLAIPTISQAYGTSLALNASTANLSIPGGITNVGQLTVNGAGNTSLGTITGAGPLIKSGAGKLTLSGSSTYSGATNISAGTLALSSTGGWTATSGISIASGATLDVSANPSFTLPSSTTVLNGSGTILGNYNHSTGILQPGTSTTIGTLTVNGTLGLTGGSVNLTISGSNNSTGGTYNDLLNVTGALDLSGTTTLNLSPVTPTLPSGTTWTVISYNGSAPVGTGTINVSTSAFSVITLPNAIELKYNSGSVGTDLWTGSVNTTWDTSTANFVPFGSSSTPISFTNGDSVLFNDSSTVTNVSLASALSPSSVTVNSNTSNYTFNGSGSITGAASLTKQGSSTLTISGSNTYTGTTTISGGTVIVNNTTGVALGTGPIVIAANATLQVGDGGADGIINPSNSSSPITDNGLLAFNTSSSLSPPSTITGTGAVYYNVGSIGVGNVNTYSGGTTIAGGIITAYEPTSFGTGPVVITGGYILTDFGADFPNNFNLSGTAIHTGGSSVSEIGGTTILANNTTIAEDGHSGLIFGSSVTSSNNSNLILPAGGYGVTFDGNVSLGSGQIQSSTIVTLNPASASSITISSSITGSGSVVHSGSGTTTLSGSNSYTGGTNVSAGTLVVTSSNGLPVGGALTIGSGATVQAAAHTGGPSNVSVLQVSTLSNSGTLNLTNNSLAIASGSTVASVTTQVAAAYNGGLWNGTSSSGGVITSTTAASDSTYLTAIGVATGLTSFDGVSVPSTDILVKYTYYGDTNLDGAIDGSDYTNIDNGFLNNMTGWQNGDFNYDNVVDGSDYTLIDNAYNTQGTSLGTNPATLIASNTAQIAGSSAVPEPTTLGLLGIGAVGLIGRRRRHH